MFDYYNDSELITEITGVYRDFSTGKNDAHKHYLKAMYNEIIKRQITDKLYNGVNMGLEALIKESEKFNSSVKNNFTPEPIEVYDAIESEPIKAEPVKKTRKQSISTPEPLTGLQAWIEQVAKSGIDETKVRDIIKQELSAIVPRTIEIKTHDTTFKVEGKQHYYFELVLKCISAGVNLALSGSTATSKTTMAIQSAKALGRNYYIQPMNDGTTKSDIMGYMSASGDYIASSFYRAMTEGAYYIAEEIDSGSPACLLVLNNAVDNRECTFPNGETVQAKEGFQVICTMNTKGTGSDRKFVGRNRLDAATLDRFCLIDVPTDRSLAAGIIGVNISSDKLELDKGDFPSAETWFNIWERKQQDYLLSHPDKIVSMRALRDGWKLIQAGIGLDHVINICINK